MSDLSVNTPTVSPVVAAKVTSDIKSGANIEQNISAQVSKLVNVSEFVASPKGVVDPKSGFYVLQYRDSSTGEVTQQYPSVKVVDAYKSSMMNSGSEVPAQSSKPASTGSTGGASQGSVGAAQPASTPSVGTSSVGTSSVGSTSSTGSGSVGSTSSAGTTSSSSIEA